MDSQEYIKQHVNRMVAKKGSTYKATTINIPRKKPDYLSNILVFFILLIGIGTLGVMFFLSKGKDLISGLHPVAAQTTDFMKREDAQQFISSVNQRIGSLEEEMKVWKYRTWLLGVASNENVALLEKMDTTHHKVNQRGFIRIDDNWKLSPTPKHLQLTDEQKKQLVGDTVK